MSSKACYFKCKYNGRLHGFPPVTYHSYEKYCKWKDILRKEDKEKGDNFIVQNIKLCTNHFETHFVTANSRLTRHAVPTLRLDITPQQEELLSTFIEENPIVMKENLGGPKSEKVKSKWQYIENRLNAIGPDKNKGSWAEYVYEVASNLITKEDCSSETDLKGNDDLTKLERSILHVWRKETREPDSPDYFESYFREHTDNDVDCFPEDDSDNGGESEIVTFSLNAATGGQKPLLQAADIAPYEAPQTFSNVNCKCKHFDSEAQDEFDAFGKDIARQLRDMPIKTALETEKLLLSVLRSKQSKIINNSFL